MGINETLPHEIRELYEVHEWRHACAILERDFPNELTDLIGVLNNFRLKKSELTAKGKGNKSMMASNIDGYLNERGWLEKQFLTAIDVDGTTRNTPTHKIDCYKNKIALEIEWNNKDPFFDRDLNNFRLLFDLRVISVGIIITRADDLAGLTNAAGIIKNGNTTHLSALLPRIEGGGGGGCPILVFGITRALYVDDINYTTNTAEANEEEEREFE